MSAHGETTLIQHLVDVDALLVLATEGLDDICVPSDGLRQVYVWAMDYWHRSGRTAAPSVATLRAEFADTLDDRQIDLDHEPEDSIEWVIDDLKGSYAHAKGNEFLMSMAKGLSDAQTGEKTGVLAAGADELMNIAFMLENRSARVDVREGMSERLSAYEARAADREQIHGLRFGLPPVDDFTRGIHPGELAVLAAPPKVGKSLMAARVAYAEWQAGRCPVLFTLENSVAMTLDRLVTIATGIPARAWQHGEVDSEQLEAARRLVAEMQSQDHPLWIIQPDLDERSVQRMVREAMLRGADSIIIDQLTFVSLPGDGRRGRWERIGEAMHTLKGMISATRDRVPCVLVHQINREGVDAARKENRLRMEHLAESAETERTADWVFGLYANDAQRLSQRVTFDILAARREDLRGWELLWATNTGGVHVLGEMTHQP